MVWLAERGYTVVGAELSELAVDEFFAERGVQPDVRETAGFIVKSHDAITLWCGDFFALDRRALPPIDALYDRAALVALPNDMQPRYAAKIAELLPTERQVLLIGLDYNEREMSGPPFAIPQPRVHALFEPDFEVDVIDVRDGLAKADHLVKRGVTRLEETTYILKRRA